MKSINIEDMAAFCKRKGIVYRNSDIYGGLAGFWDFGPLGVEIKNNIKNELWKSFVTLRKDVVGIDGSLINHEKVWKASGHLDSFSDYSVQCKKCKNNMRADYLIEDQLKISADGLTKDKLAGMIKKHKIVCEKCKGDLENINEFNLMFSTKLGSGGASTGYLRPETAQLIFTNFKLVADNARLKLPFGIAQAGKAFRNEISPRDFLFRVREFEMFEIEFFVHPKKLNECQFFKDIEKMQVNVITAEMQNKKKKHSKMTVGDLVKKKIIKTKWHGYWLASFYKWFLDIGIRKENLRLREHMKDELAHYASACFDIEYNFPFGWKEIHGNADRTDFDLKQHIKHSKTDLSLYDEETKQKVIPFVVSEPSQGIERAMLALLFDAYEDDKKRGNIVLHLSPKIAPVKVMVAPLVNKLDKQALEIYERLKTYFSCSYDKSGSIGRRYARADESGVAFAVTVDFDTEKDKSVTVRDRESTKQVRVKLNELDMALCNLINGEKLEKVGKLVK